MSDLLEQILPALTALFAVAGIAFKLSGRQEIGARFIGGTFVLLGVHQAIEQSYLLAIVAVVLGLLLAFEASISKTVSRGR